LSKRYLVKLEMLIAHMLRWVVTERNSRIYPISILWPPNSPDLNAIDNSMWEMLQEKVYKTCIAALELSTMLLTLFQRQYYMWNSCIYGEGWVIKPTFS